MKKEDKIWTIIDIVRWGTDFFKSKGVDSPRLTIELMLCEVLGISRIDIYTQFEKPLKKEELDKLRDMVSRRAKREPLQYIIGKTEFYGLEIMLDNSVLIPRPETELLVDLIIKEYMNQSQGLKILDIGTGTGCIALALAQNLSGSIVTALDNSKEALELAEKNAVRLDIKNIKSLYCNILEEIPSTEKFNVVVSNPPYIPYKEFLKLEPEVQKFEPEEALTDRSDGLTYYRRFSEILPDILEKAGRMYIEFGYGQSRNIGSIFEAKGLTVNIYKDLSGIDRIARLEFL